MKKKTFKTSSVFLVLANLVPLFGAIFLGSSLFSVIFIYWLENVIVGIFNIFRMSIAEGKDGKEMKIGGTNKIAPKSFLIFFFIMHYGIFTLVHGIFVFTLFGWSGDLDFQAIALAAGSIFISHLVSNLINFIGKGEYKMVSSGSLFMQPYKRVLVLHFVILFGGFAASLFLGLGMNIFPLVILIVIKIIIDLWMHNSEHALFSNTKKLKKS